MLRKGSIFLKKGLKALLKEKVQGR